MPHKSGYGMRRNYDPEGMDPEMAATLRGEEARREKVRLLTGGGEKAAQATGKVESIVQKILRRAGIGRGFRPTPMKK